MHPTISHELAQARLADLRDQAQRGARARTARQARHARARLNRDEAKCQALLPRACSDRMRRVPRLWRRRSGSPCSSSVSAAEPGEWRRSSATIRRQPSSACAGPGRYSTARKGDHRCRVALSRGQQRSDRAAR